MAVFRRWREAFPIAAIALLPLRVPLEIGGDTANLLVPLYLVIAAGAIASLSRRDRPAAVGPPGSGWPLWLRYALAATLVLYAIQSSYSRDVANAIENAGFFLVPFAVMFALLCEVEWTRRLLGGVLVAVGGVAAAIAVIAIYQYFARDLFLNPELFDANQLHEYFRVNSVFFDPNILGRYLALAITALGAYVAWGPERRNLGLALVVLGLALTALAFSFSITSFAAALAGLGMVALLRWGFRGAAAAAAVLAVGLVALVFVGGAPNSDIQSDRGFDQGHTDLIEGGLDLFGDRPLAGYGSGAFGRAFYDEIEKARTTVSHSEPINVAAEQGAVGLVGVRGAAGHRPVHAARSRRGRLAGANRGRRLLRRDDGRQLRLHRVHDRSGDLGAAGPRGLALAAGIRPPPPPRSAPECSSTCVAWRPRAPPTPPRASPRS